ncbi:MULTISPECIES: YaaR family protein [Paraliobacillus]|uniref:YaaR family protein n=1 Tax=Paraliobacillus TaxID=200903 RepID=UPI000DD49AF9|nr:MULTISPECIES: YaaR family protein [Paraliobacillus]
MKINQEMRSQVEAARTKSLPQKTNGKSFDSMVATQGQKLMNHQLEEMMKGITLQGERLARYRSFKDLAKYKRLVKDFVKEAVNYGMDLKHSHSFNLQGNNRKLTLVDEVDEKLLALTEVVLEQEKRSIGLLDLIGEIKGLLINLYS